MLKPELTKEKVMQLAQYHLRHYGRMKAAGERGDRGIRVDECAHFLRLWQGVSDKGGENLAPFEQSEIMEAVWSGEFDEMLGIDTSQGIAEDVED